MTETDVNLGEGAGTPDPDPTTDPTPTSPATGSGRFSAYDRRYLRYVAGVHDTRGAAKAAAKDAGVPAGSVRVDEV